MGGGAESVGAEAMKLDPLQIAFASWVLVTAVLGILVAIQLVLVLLFGTVGELLAIILERWPFALGCYAMATVLAFLVLSFVKWLSEVSKGSAYHRKAENYARDQLERDRRRRAKRRQT